MPGPKWLVLRIGTMARVAGATPCEAQHDHVVLLVWRKRHDKGNASSNTACMRLEAHDFPHSHCAGDGATDVFQVLHELLRRGRQAHGISEFRQVAVDLLHFTIHVFVSTVQSFADTDGAPFQFFCRESVGPVLALDGLVRMDRAREVHCAAEQDVAHTEAQEPIATQLLLDTAGHEAHPLSEFNSRRIGFTPIPWNLGPGCHVWHADAILEAEGERHAEVPRIELFSILRPVVAPLR